MFSQLNEFWLFATPHRPPPNLVIADGPAVAGPNPNAARYEDERPGRLALICIDPPEN